MYTHVLVHYGEIGLKGDNRPVFEKQLIDNIKSSAAAHFFRSVTRVSGRIVVRLQSEYDVDIVRDALSRIYGIVYGVFVEEVAQDIDAMRDAALRQVKSLHFKTFAVRARRNHKRFPLSQLEIEQTIGGAVDQVVEACVDLGNPELTVRVIVVDNKAFVGCERFEGAGGLPVGVSGRVMVLLSGGIDSPVAASLLQKRGCPVDFVHFHNAPYTSDASRDKAVNLATMLATAQTGSHLFLVPFTDIQKEIVKHCDQQYRVLLYRRFMLRCAQVLATKLNIQVLATGDNLAQVASQTIENMTAVQAAVSMPILRPLLTYDKQEIVDIAKRIGTFEESSLPHEDCCSYFMPRRPSTHATIAQLDAQEKLLQIDTVWDRMLDSIEDIVL